MMNNNSAVRVTACLLGYCGVQSGNRPTSQVPTANNIALIMEAVNTSETSVYFHEAGIFVHTRRR
jgi:hypothetical protein